MNEREAQAAWADPAERIADLEGQVARLENSLRRERKLTAGWKRKARLAVATKNLLDALNRVSAELSKEGPN